MIQPFTGKDVDFQKMAEPFSAVQTLMINNTVGILAAQAQLGTQMVHAGAEIFDASMQASQEQLAHLGIKVDFPRFSLKG